MNIIKKIYRKLPEKIKKIVRRILKHENKFNKEKFLKKLLKYDVISFDIFDTLITRTILNPDDIFSIMEEKVSDIKLKDSIFNMRKKAEQQARERLKKDVNIDEIYFELADIYGYDEKTINKLKGLEVDLEYQLTTPRKDMLYVLEQLVKRDKKVILVSDMYLNDYIIKNMLEKCGYIYEKHYNRFYLSNDKNKRKDDGTMWKYIRALYNGMKFIHIGDNEESDYQLPMQYGLNAMIIDNPRKALQKTNYFLGIQKHIQNITNSDSLFLGYIINEVIFNSPFSNDIDTLDKLSKSLIGPMILELLKFVDNNTSNNDKLLFLAREGYNLEFLYKGYVDKYHTFEKDHVYFLSSRKAAMGATLENIDDIKALINKEYTGTLSMFLKNIFEIDYKGEDFNIKLPDDFDKVYEIVKTYSKEILNHSKDRKQAYLNYINNICSKKDNLNIIDLGYSGTIQYHLSKLLKKDLKGLYLANSDTVKRYSDKSELLFAFDINENKNYKKIYEYSLIIEYFLSAPYGQLQGFDMKESKAIPIYNNEVMDQNKKKNIDSIFSSVVEYMDRISSLEKIYKMNISKDLLCDNYTSLVESNLIERKVKDYFDFMDSFTNVEPKNVFKIISRY